MRQLKDELRNILRMIIITYVMGHTLTIPVDERDRIVSNLRQRAALNEYHKFTSPRIANMQLKYFFATIRNQMYEKTLQRLDQLLRASRPKGQTWMQSFCIMLGLAMVGEECQRLLHIQADARVRRQEENFFTANETACCACTHIDERFNFLTDLYQCKYRKRGRGEARFEDHLSDLNTSAEREFVDNMQNLVDQKRK